MKEELYEKIVRYEPYEWQKKDKELTFVDFLIFSTGCLIGIFVYSLVIGQMIVFGMSAVTMIIISFLTSLQKKKVYYRKIK